jgi:hypothetical protein
MLLPVVPAFAGMTGKTKAAAKFLCNGATTFYTLRGAAVFDRGENITKEWT